MNSVQLYLFPESLHPLCAAQKEVARTRDLQKGNDAFMRSIFAKIASAGAGGVVGVGCSPVVRQGEIVESVVKRLSSSDPTGEYASSVLHFAAPPQVQSVSKQLNVLHDRYRQEVGVLDVRYRQKNFALQPLGLPPGTDTEGIADLLVRRDIKYVFITNGENLVPGGGRVSDQRKLFSHIEDIARRSKVPHVILGHRRELLKVTGGSDGCHALKLALQPLYGNSEDEVTDFASLLAAMERHLGKLSNANLGTEEMAKVLMGRVGGDPCRMSLWLSDAISEAARLQAAKLELVHLRRTGPNAADVKTAREDLEVYLKWMGSDSLADFNPLHITVAKEEAPPKSAPNNRRPGRNPTRDSYPRAA